MRIRLSRAVGVASFLVARIGESQSGAQGASGDASADSAAVARAAWGRASAAVRAGDVSAARREIARAAHAWPTQPAYIWATTMFALRANDTTSVLSGLRRYAALGVGRDLTTDRTLAKYAALPAFAAVSKELLDGSRPLARSHVMATFGDSTFWAEGVDVDPATRRFYVTSIRHRTIAVVSPDGTTRELWPRDRADVGAMFGVRFDTARQELWATTSGIPQMQGYRAGDSTIAALLEVRPTDGAIRQRWDLPPVPGGHVLGDLAIGPRGDVFMTDSNHPVLYWLRPGADTLESITSPLFNSLQGLAPTPDGRVLYLADYSHGLLRVDLSSRAITRLDDAPNSTSLGCDGIVWDRGAIVAVQNGVAPARVVRFALDPTGTRIARLDVLDRNTSIADEPSIGTIVGGEFVYVANGQWEKHDDAGARIPAKALSPTVLLAVPLGPLRSGR